MSVHNLENYLPENALPYLRKWFAEEFIHIKITRGRSSKLGDYRKKIDGTHEITINSTLEPQLFFFVLTHELAHLIAFENFGRRISPHGKEWKITFGKMIIESISVYKDDLQRILIPFSTSPKANFMSSTELVRYFHIKDEDAKEVFVEELSPGDYFMYQRQKYQVEAHLKKNYLCKNMQTGRKYSFKPLAKVEKCN